MLKSQITRENHRAGERPQKIAGSIFWIGNCGIEQNGIDRLPVVRESTKIP